MLQKSLVSAWLMCLMLPPVADAAGGGRTGELDVRPGNNGAPCFTVSAHEEQRSGTPQFQSITVSEAGAVAEPPMWSMVMPKGRTFALAYYMCVPYGGRPPVLPQTPAARLQPGKPYEVVVHAVPGKPGAPRYYRARFCVRKGGMAQAHAPVNPAVNVRSGARADAANRTEAGDGIDAADARADAGVSLLAPGRTCPR